MGFVRLCLNWLHNKAVVPRVPSALCSVMQQSFGLGFAGAAAMAVTATLEIRSTGRRSKLLIGQPNKKESS